MRQRAQIRLSVHIFFFGTQTDAERESTQLRISSAATAATIGQDFIRKTAYWEGACVGPESYSDTKMEIDPAAIADLASRLASIELKLEQLIAARAETAQQYYSTADVARIMGKAEWTVREWCRLGRINADKRECGRGSAREWMISHDELERIKSEGLLAVQAYRHRVS